MGSAKQKARMNSIIVKLLKNPQPGQPTYYTAENGTKLKANLLKASQL